MALTNSFLTGLYLLEIYKAIDTKMYSKNNNFEETYVTGVNAVF